MSESIKRVGVLAAAFFLTSCRESVLSSGRYVGEFTHNGGLGQVVADLPDFVRHDGSANLHFTFYRVLGSAQGVPIEIRVNDKKNRVVIKADFLGPEDFTFDVGDGSDCATTRSKAVVGEVKLCIAPDDLRITLFAGAGDIGSELVLKKGDHLPPKNPSDGPSAHTLDELMGRARFSNYNVSVEAERVFQAKQSVRDAMADLLPSLSVGAVLSYAAEGPFALIGAVGDLLPFLFPSNWYRKTEARILLEAEQHAFAALQRNEMNAVETLFYTIMRDQNILGFFREQGAWLESLQQRLRVEEMAEALPTGTAAFFTLTVAAIQMDTEKLAALVEAEMAALAHAVALPAI